MSWRGLLGLLISVGIVAAGAVGGCSLSRETGTGGGATGGSGPTIVASTGSSSGTTSIGSSGTGGSTGGGGIAAACTADADCRSGLECVLDIEDDPIFGGGPVGGFCTRACNDDAQCGETGAVCLKLDPSASGRCTLSCTIGPPITSSAGFFDPLSPDKCRGREDVRCGKPKMGVGVCLPTCGHDDQCHGRACDPRLTVCVTHANDGLPSGASCTPGEEPSPCGGICVGFESGIGMCSSPCVLGGEKESTADCGGLERGFCAFRSQTNGVGDVGFCSPSCTSQAECESPNFWCFSVPGLTEVVKRGYCFTATPCPNGQGDCTGATYCTDTPSGALCLDPAYPLESPATDGGAP